MASITASRTLISVIQTKPSYANVNRRIKINDANSALNLWEYVVSIILYRRQPHTPTKMARDKRKLLKSSKPKRNKRDCGKVAKGGLISKVVV